MQLYIHDGRFENDFSFINVFGKLLGILASIMFIGGYAIVSHRLRLFAKYPGNVHATTPSETPATESSESDAEPDTHAARGAVVSSRQHRCYRR